MAKTFSVKLEIEEIALGTVLRKLHDMPGIARLDLDFGEGGKGAGKEKLQQAAAALNVPPAEAILKVLANGPMRSRDLTKTLGMSSHRVYYAISKLGQAIQRNGKGEFELAPLALPKPDLKRGPNGRASPGVGPAALRIALAAADHPVPVSELKSLLSGHGLSPKSVAGVILRAKRDRLIKGGKDGYVLTAKAEKNGAAHG